MKQTNILIGAVMLAIMASPSLASGVGMLTPIIPTYTYIPDPTINWNIGIVNPIQLYNPTPIINTGRLQPFTPTQINWVATKDYTQPFGSGMIPLYTPTPYFGR
jgi:hypothetical protein